MRRQVWHTLSAAAAAVGSAVLLTAGFGAGDAVSAATATHASVDGIVYTTNQAGYVTGGGRHFRFIQSTIPVSPARKAPQWAELVLGGVRVSPVTVAVKAGGGANSVGWAVGTQPFGRAGGPLSKLSPAPGDILRLSLYFDQQGHVFITAVDTTKGVSQTVRVTVPKSTLYTAAEAAVYETGYTAPVKSPFHLWAFTATHVTTYSGVKGTMLGPWSTKVVVAVAGGKQVMAPLQLVKGGANFGVWRV